MPNTRDRFRTVHTYIPTVHSGTEPGPHGFGLGFCASALMILYVLVLVVCHMTDNKCMISVTETIRDTVAYKKIDCNSNFRFDCAITISDNKCRNKLYVLH